MVLFFLSTTQPLCGGTRWLFLYNIGKMITCRSAITKNRLQKEPC